MGTPGGNAVGMHVNLMALWLTDPVFWWNAIQVALGVGAVIFVHELGHFAVAKMCGVKCEKFYLGFDIGGLKLFKFRWGETEYGIGILPLGGYVKMLGQDDNPAKAAEEMERAKLHAQQGVATPEEAVVLDPRSYMAQSVPERMAIISAGVIMNVIFAFVVIMIAYGMGVQYQPAIVGDMAPGDEAWRVGLKSDDEIVRIGGIENPRFEDIMKAVVLGNIDNGVELKVRRPGEEDLLSFNLLPVRKGLMPRIGVTSPALTSLSNDLPRTNSSGPATGLSPSMASRSSASRRCGASSPSARTTHWKSKSPADRRPRPRPPRTREAQRLTAQRLTAQRLTAQRPTAQRGRRRTPVRPPSPSRCPRWPCGRWALP
jgi:membrane-associated protease RseP (regulator of RpoE activity)